MPTLSKHAFKALKQGAYPKFAATVDDKGVPNVVPLLSAQLIDDDTIAFVRFMVWKTRRNFEANHKICFGCRGPRGKTILAQCEFSEWVTQGPLLEQFNDVAIYRYNAYSGANMVGVVKIKQVRELPAGPLLSPVISPLRTFHRRHDDGPANGGPMPPEVMDKWSRRLALRFLGLADGDGFPWALPQQALYALDPRSLVFTLPKTKDHPIHRLQTGDKLAASVMTADPAAYQVKGTYAGNVTKAGLNLGVLEVNQVYAASPPFPGKRLYPAEVLGE